MLRLRRWIAAVLLACGLVALAGAAPSIAQETIKIGVILPLSGPLAPTGQELRRGYELMVDIVNNVYPELAALGLEVAGWNGIPALGGAKIEPIFADSRGDPSVGADMARRLILEQGVVGLMGAYQSSVTQTVATVAEREGIPLVNSDSSSPTLTMQGFEWFWRVTPHDMIFDDDLFNLLDGLVEGRAPGVPPVAKESIRRLAVVVENTEFGSATGDDIVNRLAPARGYEVVDYMRYQANSPDLTSEVTRLVNSGADTYLFASYVSDAILFMRTLALRGAKPALIWGQNAGFTNPDFVQALGANLHGVLTRSLFIAKIGEVRPIAAAINELYRQRHGTNLSEESAREMVGVLTWAYALHNAASTSPAALQRALNELEIPGDQLITPWEGIKFGAGRPGERNQNIYATGMIGQYQYHPESGEVTLEIVYPFDAATADMVFPFPGWD